MTIIARKTACTPLFFITDIKNFAKEGYLELIVLAVSHITLLM